VGSVTGDERLGLIVVSEEESPVARRSKKAVTAIAAVSFTGAVMAFSVADIRSFDWATAGSVQEGPGMVSVHTRTFAS